MRMSHTTEILSSFLAPNLLYKHRVTVLACVFVEIKSFVVQEIVFCGKHKTKLTPETESERPAEAAGDLSKVFWRKDVISVDIEILDRWIYHIVGW